MGCRVGVPDAELAVEQPLELNVKIWPLRGFDEMGDRIEATVDYAAVCGRLTEVARARPRRLIETLASELVDVLLGEFACRAAFVEVRKRILPETEWVAVQCFRRRAGDGLGGGGAGVAG